jgi:hypothetical protein
VLAYELKRLGRINVRSNFVQLVQNERSRNRRLVTIYGLGLLDALKGDYLEPSVEIVDSAAENLFNRLAPGTNRGP